jgi:ubiquinone/menaquinone biosynthesis C-methylase UbiE
MVPLEREVLRERRARLLTGVSGVALDVGAGTGANLEHLRSVDRLIATEPDPGMRKRLAAKLISGDPSVQVLDAPAESLPLIDDSVDAVIFTCVLCTVADVDRALAEARRVLRPGGRLIVLEHVRGAGNLAEWQDRITPLWSRAMGGCHPNRDIGAAIARAGFAFEQIDRSDPFPRWVPTRPMLEAICVAG